MLPWKQRCVVRDGGMVRVTPGRGWPEMNFYVNGQNGLYLENGHALLVACDPADPAAGAYICNADRTVRNRAGWGFGEKLIESAYPITAKLPTITKFISLAASSWAAAHWSCAQKPALRGSGADFEVLT
ncbi:MAG: hypothetical protein QM680_14750 [Luteolibacter sp.]